ncbi:hypothetical protein A0H76_709 [Hepatospora eriocheir]|uniref:Uncharacterized protein n=1 Tax=Hepatospora eriocheir TaxID=1081669 RepID=A0A1X0QIC8_9MICR|nr:hypothetical protein A0H76_709 [Hepatospora eriocheir]
MGKNQDHFEFTVIGSKGTKRNRLPIEIDLSEELSFKILNENKVVEEIKLNSIDSEEIKVNKKAKKANLNKKNKKTKKEEIRQLDSISQYEDTQTLFIPEQKESIKSDEIYKVIKKQNINEFILESLKFLKVTGQTAIDIYKACSANYFKDIDYNKEIEQTNKRIIEVENEINKWNDIYKSISQFDMEIANLEEIYTERDKEMLRIENERIKKSFLTKSINMGLLKGRIENKLEKYKKRANDLLSKFLLTSEIEEYPLFLLKAMAKN